jgi:L-histidine N-alpha-methyltransferase
MSCDLESRIHTPSGAEWVAVEASGYKLHVDLAEADEVTLEQSVAETLADDPPWLHCRWLYDEVGSALYEHITEQPEYYPTRTEDSILAANIETIFDLAAGANIVELGSGSSSKTRHVLDAWLAHGRTCYVPIDISRAALEGACAELSRTYPELEIEGINARYARAFPLLRDISPLLLMFLGSTIGNFSDGQLDEFLGMVAMALSPGDHFLLGIDLIKPTPMLNRAYNDEARFTERFMINILARMNRELGTDIPLDTVVYEGAYNEARERVEMYLRFTEETEVRLPETGAVIRIPANERVMIEISRKFDVTRAVDKLGDFGFTLEQCFSDPEDLFALLLLEREA